MNLCSSPRSCNPLLCDHIYYRVGPQPQATRTHPHVQQMAPSLLMRSERLMCALKFQNVHVLPPKIQGAAGVDMISSHFIWSRRVGPQLAFNSVFLGFELLKLYRICSQASPGTFPCWQVLHFRTYALSFLKSKISCLSLLHLTWARVEWVTWAKYVLTNWSHCRRETKSTLEINLSGIIWGSSKYCASG